MFLFINNSIVKLLNLLLLGWIPRNQRVLVHGLVVVSQKLVPLAVPDFEWDFRVVHVFVPQMAIVLFGAADGELRRFRWNINLQPHVTQKIDKSFKEKNLCWLNKTFIFILGRKFSSFSNLNCTIPSYLIVKEVKKAVLFQSQLIFWLIISHF